MSPNAESVLRTNVVLTVMLYMLYELSIILSLLVFRNKEKKRLAEEAAEATA